MNIAVRPSAYPKTDDHNFPDRKTKNSTQNTAQTNPQLNRQPLKSPIQDISKTGQTQLQQHQALTAKIKH